MAEEQTTVTASNSPLEELKGSFVASLTRNNRKIREDRAIAIAESAQMIYKRTVEDLEMDIKQLKRAREAQLDLSPDTATSLVPAQDFNAATFVSKDIDFGVELRNKEIKLEIARARYNELFT